jgi:hypothetical protein
MKILIMGSVPHGLDSSNVTGSDGSGPFEAFCKQLGIAIAKMGHEIVITSDSRDTADYHVAIGMDSENGKISAVWPVDKVSKSPNMPNIKNEINCVRIQSGLTTGRIQQLTSVDLVIMVGGNVKTKEMLPLCLLLEVPFVAIPQFDGSARQIYDRLIELLASRDKGIHAEAVKIGSHGMDGKSSAETLRKVAEGYVKLADRIRKVNPVARENARLEITVLLTVIVAGGFAFLGGWLSYNYKNLLPILLCWIAAVVLGSLLAVHFDRAVTNAGIHTLSAKILRNISGAVIVSVVTLVVLILAQFPTTGKVDPAANLEMQGDYLRLSIVVFAVAFACAWRYEPWKARLSKQIEKLGESLR